MSPLGTTINGLESRVLEASGVPSPRVAVWFDGDKAGRKGRDKTIRRLQLFGCSVTPINTPKDPKEYSMREIKEILIAGSAKGKADSSSAEISQDR